MQANTSGAIDQNMSRPSCSSRGLAGLGAGCGWLVTSPVSQPIPEPSSSPLLGESPTMTVSDRSFGPGSSPTASPAVDRRREAPDRNLAMELVRVTEAGAMAAGRWVGRGDKEGGDGAAVDAMRELVNSVSMRGVVVIGEGEKDNAPMLYNGEEVGNGDGPDCDFAVDPIDGTTLMAKGMPNAISVLAVAERGAMFDPSAVFYMNKIAVGPDAADVIDITAPIAREHPRGRQGRRTVGRRHDGVHPGPAAARRADRRRARDRRPDPADHRRRRRRRDLRVPAGLRHRHAGRYRRHPGGHHRRRRDPLHGRRDPGPAGAHATTPNARRPSTPATTWTGC